MRIPHALALNATLLALAGCATGPADPDPFGSGGPDETGTSGGPASSSTSSSSSSDSGDPGGSTDPGGSDSDGDDIKFDTPDGNTGPGDTDGGCEKVDFLFVVDNSGSMWDNQKNLANSFPGFISTIQDTLQAKDFHILVTDSDPWTPASTNANMDVACETYPECCYEFCGPNSKCKSFFTGDTSYGVCPTPPDPPTACDATLGAGRNIDKDLAPCNIQGGKRYMTDTQPDLEATFTCVAQAGIGGDWNEQPVNATVAAVASDINGAGGCNDGFLRDDAILVVTIISDANKYSGHLDTDADMQGWYQALVAAKNGDPTSIVMLGLFPDGHLPGGVCTTGNEKYEQWIDMWDDHGIYGSVCAPDYTPFFLDAVNTIDLTCDDFVPPQG